MNFSEIVGLWIHLLKPLVPYIAILLVVTIITFWMIAIKGSKIWMNDQGFGYLSIFFNMNFFSAIKLSCVWLKLLLIMMFIIGFQPLGVIHYLFILVPCILMIFISTDLMELINHIINTCIQAAGLVALNILCSYILEFEFEVVYIVAYVFIAILVILYSIYIFISELDAISLGRRTILDEDSKNEQIQEESWKISR